jgi:hypothetical protein
MSHYDYFARPSICIFLCALLLGTVGLYAEQGAWFFGMLSCGLLAWGMVINWREHTRDVQYWKSLATGLADQLIDRQSEMRHYQQASDTIEMMETIHGGRVYHGPVTAADIYEPLLVDGEEA